MIGRRHALALLAAIGNAGPIRFSELRGRLGGISASTLAIRLGELEAAGLVTREIYAEVPPRVEYSLTAQGTTLRRRLKAALLPLVRPPASQA